jgi:hypothetical protein
MESSAETNLGLETTSSSAANRSVNPLFPALTRTQVAEIVAYVRFPNDPRQRQELLSSKSVRVSPNELLVLYRANQLPATLDRLDRMEQHYLDVSKLDAAEVRRGLDASDPDDLGALAYKWCLANDGADPRLQIAKRILALIPIARRQVEAGKPALELNELFMLNDQANMLLIDPHLRRGLDILAATRAGGRRQNPGGKNERQMRASEFLEARKAEPSLTQQEFVQCCNPRLSVKTLQRGLKDLRNSPL